MDSNNEGQNQSNIVRHARLIAFSYRFYRYSMILWYLAMISGMYSGVFMFWDELSPTILWWSGAK